jgi:hypothetical protein
MKLFFIKKKLFQNFSFWNSFLRFNRKTGPLAGFSKSLSKTNRVLEQAQNYEDFLMTSTPLALDNESRIGSYRRPFNQPAWDRSLAGY